jgi:hypothetical protein
MFKKLLGSFPVSVEMALSMFGNDENVLRLRLLLTHERVESGFSARICHECSGHCLGKTWVEIIVEQASPFGISRDGNSNTILRAMTSQQFPSHDQSPKS